MDGFERRKRQKMEQIFEVAFVFFLKYGFQKSSVSEIAQQANVSPATIYNYFGTKEQLYADTLVHWMDKQLAACKEILAADLSFPEKTKQIMGIEAASLNFLADAYGKLPASHVKEWTQLMDDYSERQVEKFFHSYVALGKQEGYIHPDQTEETALRYFMLFKHELARYWASSGPKRSSESLDPLIELFFYGLAGRER